MAGISNGKNQPLSLLLSNNVIINNDLANIRPGQVILLLTEVDSAPKTCVAPVTKTCVAPVTKTCVAPVIKTCVAPVIKTCVAPVIKTCVAPAPKTCVALITKPCVAPAPKTSVIPIDTNKANALSKFIPIRKKEDNSQQQPEKLHISAEAAAAVLNACKARSEFKTQHLKKKTFKCLRCNCLYADIGKLKLHIKRYHSKDSASHPTKPISLNSETKKWCCPYCNSSYKTRSKINCHIRDCHPKKSVPVKMRQICPLCDAHFRKISDIHNHIKCNHKDTPLHFEKKIFSSVEEFEEWKERMETDTVASFVNYHVKSPKEQGLNIRYYSCHRSGFYEDLTKHRRRQLKRGGSVKIGRTCPAAMKLFERESPTGSIYELQFQSVHVGHEMDADKVALPKVIKKQIADEMSQGIPKTEILSNVKKMFPTRTITLKCLHNIARNFNIDKALMFKNEAVDTKIQKLLKEKGNAVIIYKPIGNELSDYPSISKDEFLFGLMNDKQKDLLQLYGNDVILIDSLYGVNPLTFQLTVLLVNDGTQEGLPVAFLYSYTPTEETFIVFFIEIRKRLSINLQPKVFMSDGSPSFYNAWKCVFGTVPRQLISHSYLWHICRTNVNCRVKDPVIRKHVKKEIRRIMNECNEATFERCSKQCVTQWLNSESTVNFGRYFDRTYMNCTDMWASCYRLGLNTNIKMEYWYQELKYSDTDRKVIKCIGKSLDVLFRAISKKLIPKMKSIDQRKIAEFITYTHKRHLQCQKMQGSSVLEIQSKSHWKISDPSQIDDSTSLDTYHVNFAGNCNCSVRCNECNVCIHQFTCTCYDYCMELQICKHIHFISQNYAGGLSNIELVKETNSSPDVIIDTIDYVEDNSLFVDEIGSCASITDFDTEKAVLSTKIQNLQDLILQSQSYEQLREIHEGLDNIEKQWLDVTERVLAVSSLTSS